MFDNEAPAEMNPFAPAAALEEEVPKKPEVEAIEEELEGG
jgi:hypothetical protein